MTAPDASLDDLSVAERGELEHLLEAFDLGWTPDALGRFVARLPAGVAWRRYALVEALHIDRERHERNGTEPPFAEYRRLFARIAPGTPCPPEFQPADTFQRGDTTADLPHACGQVIGRYRLLRVLGEGGMGVVYLAHDPTLDRQVALKVPRGDWADDPGEADRLRREARAAARLSHPNICAVFEVGEADGVPYLACQYVDGQPLTAAMKGMPLTEATTLVAAVARAVGHAHRHGVIHRDLKPGNILLTADGRPVVTDFGLARLAPEGADLHATMTRPGGSPAYMAPEQIVATRAGPASDQFSLGLVLYELLAGRRPFPSRSVADVMRKLAEQPIPPPSTYRATISPALDAVCMRALEKQPVARFADMEGFAEAIERAAGTERPPRQWSWRKAAMLVTLTLALLACIPLAFWLSGPTPTPHAPTPLVPAANGYAPAYASLPGYNDALIRKRPEFRAGPIPASKGDWIAVLERSTVGMKDPDAHNVVDDQLLAIEAVGRLDIKDAIPALVELLRAGRGNRHSSIRREAANALGYLGRDRGNGPNQEAVNALADRIADDIWIANTANNEKHPWHTPFVGVAVTDPVYCGKGTALTALEALAPDRARQALLAIDALPLPRNDPDKAERIKLMKKWAKAERTKRNW